MIGKVARLIGIFVLVASSIPSVLAQGGSNYSAIGIGDIRRTTGALYEAVAGTSVAMPMDHGINVVNPAMLGLQPSTRLQVGYRFNQHMITDGSGSSIAQNNGEFDGVLANFVVDTAYGFAVAFGLVPYTSVNYQVANDLYAQVDGVGASGQSVRTGDGGMSELYLAVCGKVIPDLHVGIAMLPMFGNIILTDEVTLYGSGNYSTKSQSTFNLRGIQFRGGLYWTVTPHFNLGATVAGGANGSLLVNDHVAASRGVIVTYDSTVITNSATPLPLSVALGASLSLGRSIVGVDIEMCDYTQVQVRGESTTYGRSYRASVGITRPGNRIPLVPFIERMGFHAGVCYQSLYYTYQGNPVREFMASVGTDLPVGGNSIVDIAITGGLRGTGVSSHLQELFLRGVFSMSIGEQWFKPFLRE